jgi:hypothetical protein
VAVQPMHQGNIRKPWQKKILQEYAILLFNLIAEETMPLRLTILCHPVPKSSKHIRKDTITSSSEEVGR